MKYIRPRWRKVIRDLWSNKSRTVLVMMAIAVGIFAVGVVSGSQETITRVLNESWMDAFGARGKKV
jgi:putative ABC transport system permease protein